MTTRTQFDYQLLAAARRLRGLTVNGLAARARVPLPDLEAWETGLDVPSVPEFERLRDALDIDPRLCSAFCRAG